MTARLKHFHATLDTYRRHGWQLARALMTLPTRAELSAEPHAEVSTDQVARQAATDDPASASASSDASPALIFENAPVVESEFDAMWFRRPAAGGREAWELRLAAEPYALFELFEPDEAEEDREDVRRELEQRVRERGKQSRNDER